MNVSHMHIHRWVPAVALLALAAGCTSLAPKQENWQGHQISELIARRGPADRIALYPYGGTLYIWEKPESSFEAFRAGLLDDTARVASFVQREIVLVSDAGIILRTQVTTEPAGAR
jgi:hypothetical protein